MKLDIMKKSKIRFLAMVLVVMLAFFSSACSLFGDSPEDVAKEYIEAICIDFDGDAAVDLMSSAYLEKHMKESGCESESELATYMEKAGVIIKTQAYVYDKFGDDWEAKVTKVKVIEARQDRAFISVSISNKGSKLIFEDTYVREFGVYLVKEDGDWRVDGIV